MELSQYLEVFIEECREHLQNCNENLLKLEKDPENLDIVNEIFRSAHTLKGMAATMGYEYIANLTHQMKNVLDGVRNGKYKFTPELLDIIFIAMDHLEEMVESIASGGDGQLDVSEATEKLKMIEEGTTAGQVPEKGVKEAENGTEQKLIYDEFEITVLEQAEEQGYDLYEVTVMIRPDCLLKSARVYMVFDVLEKMGEIIKSEPSVELLEEEQFDDTFTVTLVTKDSVEDIKNKIMKVSEIDKVEVQKLSIETVKEMKIELEKEKQKEQAEKRKGSKAPAKKKEASGTRKQIRKKISAGKTIRVNIERLDALMNLFEELVIDRGRLDQIAKELNHQELSETVEKMSRVTNDLQSVVLTMRMVPVETVFNRFPKMVRQLARELGKKINLKISGQETELDRTVIDEIGDPLVHLLRNSVDHGIETPEERIAKGKPKEGTIELKAYHSGNHVFIEIIDDGAGINKEKVIKKALEKGIINEEQIGRLTDQEVVNLILTSGFSTAEQVSDISGRGVGLDVVKNTIESLGGTLSVQSEEDKGTQFLIQLPLTLSIISVMLVEVQKEKYAIPLTSIIETAIFKKSDIYYAHDQPVIDFRGRVVPILFLQEIFDVPVVDEGNDYLSTVIIRKGDKMAGLVVDSFIGQEEVVLKSLGNYLTNVFAISGATILGDGQVALIIDCNVLIK